MKYVFVKQEGIMDCGISSFLMILRTHGGDCSKEYLRNLTRTDKFGTTAYDLLKAGEKFSFQSFGLKGELEDLPQSYLPVIAHVIKENYYHFVVLYEIDLQQQRVVIADPALGIKKIEMEEFKKISTKQYLIFIPEGQIPKYVKKNTLNNYLRKYLKERKKELSFIMAISAIYTLTSIISSFTLQILLKTIERRANLTLFLWTSLFFLSILILKVTSHFFRIHLVTYLFTRLDFSLFTNIYHHLFFLPNSYYQTRSMGEVTSRLQDLVTIKNSIAHLFASLFLDSILAIFTFLILLLLNFKLTLLILFILLIEGTSFYFYQRQKNQRINELKEKYAIFQTNLIDTLKQVFALRRLKQAPFIEKEMRKYYKSYLKEETQYQKISRYQNLCQMIAKSSTSFLTIMLGILFIYQNRMDLSNLLSYFFLLSFFLEPIENFFEFWTAHQETKEAIERIQELYEVEEEKEETAFLSAVQKIKIENLSFSYRGGQPIFKNQYLQIYKEDKILLYGPSGCGKSTLIRILAGYEENYEGTIYINDVPIEKVDEKKLREHVTYIAQNDDLLKRTLRENIVLGRKVEEDYLNKIYQICRIDEIASRSPLGYNRRIDENAANLSGGEKQRVILARSLLRESDIYILDESLCNLDIKLERAILKDLFTHFKDKIIIVVSHRFYNEDLYNKKIDFQRGEKLCKNYKPVI